jgi:hypothetical protein
MTDRSDVAVWVTALTDSSNACSDSAEILSVTSSRRSISRSGSAINPALIKDAWND